MTANEILLDEQIDRGAMLRLHEEKLHADLNGIVEEHRKRAINLRTKKELDKEAARFAKDGYDFSKKSLARLASDQISHTTASLKAAIGGLWETRRPRIVAENLVLDRPIFNEKTLEGMWKHLALSDRRRVEQVIRRGMAEGASPESIARDISRTTRLTYNQARAATTTGMTSVLSQADREVYRANKGAIKGWQYVATLDGRTTDVCAARDGRIFDIEDTQMLPPAHYNCRSTTVPVVGSWSDLASLENVSQVRRRNLSRLTEEEKAFYDGQTPPRESYSDWLRRQDRDTRLKHLGNSAQLNLFDSGALALGSFKNTLGRKISLSQLRRMSYDRHSTPGGTTKFESAKRELDQLKLPFATPDDITSEFESNLVRYFVLQSTSLEGTLSLTNYRGIKIGNKALAKRRVMTQPPREDQMVFNPILGQYHDTRRYIPSPELHTRALVKVDESAVLTARDKALIKRIDDGLGERISVNERAVAVDNLRVLFERYRKKPEAWGNFKAVTNNEMKYSVMNFSEAMEVQLRKDMDLLAKLRDSNYIDPVLGRTQLNELHRDLVSNIMARNHWEDVTAPRIAKELRGMFDSVIVKRHPLIWSRLNDRKLQEFYLRFAHRLSMADGPDLDALSVQLGRDLHKTANLNGDKDAWLSLGKALLTSDRAKKFYKLETFGVQKRRMRSKMSGQYFGPYYDTQAWNLRIVDKRIQEYSKLQRKIDVGLRVPDISHKQTLFIKPGYKTYFTKTKLGDYDTRVPITSTSSFGSFPPEFIDKTMADSLNWASKTRYRIDEDYFDFVNKLMYFRDDKGAAAKYHELNGFRKYTVSRGDSYERMRTMQWLREGNHSFANASFVDHRGRVYERGFIGPQSGEHYRPFLSTDKLYTFSEPAFKNLQDQIGAYLGGLGDFFEGRHNSLTVMGRQHIAEKWRREMVEIGYRMRRARSDDMRYILDNLLVQNIDGEDQAKFFRFALELSKIDEHLSGDWKNLSRLSTYRTALALEQDASASGAQIIALTTKNKQLAELSNVMPTNRKKRLYDEIAQRTYDDPRFKEINKRLGLTERDLQKGAKGANMVSFYGAGERTQILSMESKVAKALGKDKETLVISTSSKDKVLADISAQAARYKHFDPETHQELLDLRKRAKIALERGTSLGHDLMEELWFLDGDSKQLLEKMSRSYNKVVTPEDFKIIGKIMSEHLSAEVPILKEFTRFHGRLAADFLTHSRPANAAVDYTMAAKFLLRGGANGVRIPGPLANILGVKPGTRITEEFLKRLTSWDPNRNLYQIVNGVHQSNTRNMGFKFGNLRVKVGGSKWLFEFGVANKLPKRWTSVPSVNYDGKVIEQSFTGGYETRLVTRDAYGNKQVNIVNIDALSEATWWEQLTNSSGNIYDIADAAKARTAYGVNANHSNDAVLVRRFHEWGFKNGIHTSTVHDAFFGSAAQMLEMRDGLQVIYADALKSNVIRQTLDEMLARGLPKELYERYLNEAIEIGLIPIPGRSKIGGKVLTEADILKHEDVLKPQKHSFDSNNYWYGIGP